MEFTYIIITSKNDVCLLYWHNFLSIFSTYNCLILQGREIHTQTTTCSYHTPINYFRRRTHTQEKSIDEQLCGTFDI